VRERERDAGFGLIHPSAGVWQLLQNFTFFRNCGDPNLLPMTATITTTIPPPTTAMIVGHKPYSPRRFERCFCFDLISSLIELRCVRFPHTERFPKIIMRKSTPIVVLTLFFFGYHSPRLSCFCH